MNIEEAKEYLNIHADDVLEPDNQSTHKDEGAHDYGYICPICASGSGPNGTGMKRDPKSKTHFKCFACGFYGDIVQLLAERDGLNGQNYMTQLKHACRVFNITLEGVRSKQTKDAPLGWDLEPIYEAEEVPQTTKPLQEESAQKAPSLEGQTTKTDKPKQDFSALIAEALKHIDECDYLQQRGISKGLQKSMRIGFLPAMTVPSNRAHTMPALIIPLGNSAYTARNLGEVDKAKNIAKYYNAGTKGIYNTYTLHEGAGAVFVVEGEIDALSIMELGFRAVALRSASSNHKELISELKEVDPAQRPTLIIALDNDTAGATNTQKLIEALNKAEIIYHLPKPSEIYGDHKDANECLVSEREAFRGRLEALNKSPEELYNENSARHVLGSFLEDIINSKNKEPISTGFFNLNDALDGGLYAGLYVIGAISSLGKTTFTLQMADAIAAAGHDVLIFSLEMAKKELIAKSISRLSFKGMKPGDKTNELARSTRDLLSNVNRNGPKQINIIKDALKQYAEYAGNIFIIEGLGDVDINRIKNTVAKHVLCRNKTPVVIIDYLQIIAPFEPKATDKQNTDKAVLELKRLSRDYDTPVLAISSFNRDNYKEAVNMASFKESGAIEYSSDVLLGLQFAGAGVKGADLEALKRKIPREVELKILKNRNGKTGECIAFDFYPMYNDFEEV